MIGRTNVVSGGGEELYVYAQKDEPSKKEGVWVKTEEVLTDEINYTQMTNIPYYFSSYNQTVAYGTDIYMIGGSTDYSTANYMYKYDTINDTYTQLTNIPNSYNGRYVAIVGKYIYIFAGKSGNYAYADAYKYSIENNTYTSIANVPNSKMANGSAIAVGTDIYLFGTSETGDSYQYVYKYNTLTDAYTQLSNMSFPYRYGSIQEENGKIYFFGGVYSQNAYEYSIANDSYTRIANIPFSFSQGATAKINNDSILLFKGTNTYKYNISTDSYTQLTNIPYDFTSGSSNASIVGNDIYLMGGTSTTYMNNYKATPVSYPEINKFNYESIDIKNISLEDIENTYTYRNLKISAENKSYGRSVLYNSEIYTFGSISDGNMIQKFYIIGGGGSERLTSIPYNFSNANYKGIACNYKNYAYLLGGINKQYNYKYDIAEKTYSSNTSIPYPFTDGVGVRVGKYIYIFSSSNSSTYYYYAYKYDIENDTYTRLTDVPSSYVRYGEAVAIGTKIYMFNGYNSYGGYIYDTETDTYSSLTGFNYKADGMGVETNGKDIYLFGGNSSYSGAYKYNVEAKSTTSLTSTDKNFINGSCVYYNGSIYLVGVYTSSDSYSGYNIYKYIVDVPMNEDSINILSQNSTYNTKLSEKTNIDLDNVKLYTDSLQDYPAYIGNGTSWEEI